MVGREVPLFVAHCDVTGMDGQRNTQQDTWQRQPVRDESDRSGSEPTHKAGVAGGKSLLTCCTPTVSPDTAPVSPLKLWKLTASRTASIAEPQLAPPGR